MSHVFQECLLLVTLEDFSFLQEGPQFIEQGAQAASGLGRILRLRVGLEISTRLIFEQLVDIEVVDIDLLLLSLQVVRIHKVATRRRARTCPTLSPQGVLSSLQ